MQQFLVIFESGEMRQAAFKNPPFFFRIISNAGCRNRGQREWMECL